VNPGPIIKRFTARAMGRGTRVNKRTSHVVVVLGER
jgi:large subunit ribosomal protein L22